MSKGFGEGFGFPFFEGAGAATLAPYTFPLALGDFPYMPDYKLAEAGAFTFGSVPVLRQQTDQSDSPGEQSLNPAALWRRSGESWHLGAGQDDYDRKGLSSPYQFRRSTGMDTWTRWQLGLLKDTDLKLASSATNLRFAVAGSYLYVTDAGTIKYTQNILVDTPSFTDVTDTFTNNPTSIASDGFNIWTAHGTEGIWKTTRGAAATASHITGTVSLLGFARGRVLAANNNSVYDVTSLAQGGGGALPTALFSQPNTDFKWTCFAEGRNAVYMAGYSGDKSLIYRSTIKSDGSGLDVPVVAGELPDGEQIESIYGYLGPFLVIGVGGLPGWRFALINQNGDLQIGSRVKTPVAVKCFEGQENFIWFGYSNYSSSQTGLGRMSISEFGDAEGLVPAYASDIMVNGQTADVVSVVTFQGIRIFAIHAIGLYAEHHAGNLVASGTLDTGNIMFNLNEPKIGLFIDDTQIGTEGAHGFSVAADSAAFVDLGTHPAHDNPFVVGELKARLFELQIKLVRDGVDPTKVQKLTSWVFRAQPIPAVSNLWVIPVMITDSVEDLDGNPHPVDTFAQVDNLVKLNRNKTITTLRIGPRGYPVTVEDYQLRVKKLIDDRQGFMGFNGSCVITVKVVSEES